VLQEKFKNDKEALSRETMQLYRDNKVNPMAGCLPLLVQLPIFILLYQVLSKLVLTEGFSATFLGIDLGGSVYSTVIDACYYTFVGVADTITGLTEGIMKNPAILTDEVFKDLAIITKLTEEAMRSPTILMEGVIKNLAVITGLTEKVLENPSILAGITDENMNILVKNTKLSEEVINSLVLSGDIINNLATISEGVINNLISITGFTKETIRDFALLKIQPLTSLGITNVGYAVINNPAGLLNFNFYLANSLVLLANGGLMWYQQRISSSGNPQMAVMNIMMPILITYICLSLPGGVLLYWGVSSLLGVLQQIRTSKRTKKEMKERPTLYKDKPMGNH
jgi:YidC/Oxa1 family membrane protein insertase